MRIEACERLFSLDSERPREGESEPESSVLIVGTSAFCSGSSGAPESWGRFILGQDIAARRLLLRSTP